MKISSRHCCTTINLLIFLIILSSSLLKFGNAQTPTDSSSPSSSSSSPDDDYALEGSRVSPSMALIIIVLVIGFVITGCVSIYIQQCSDNPPVEEPLSANLTRVKTRPGLDQSVIDKFPTFVYSDVKDLKFGEGSLECAVCLNEFEEHETLRLLPKCDHVFHPDCIGAWLSGHTTCPVCRADLVPDPTQSSSLEETTVESGPSHEVEVTVESEPPKGRVPRSHSTGHSLAQSGESRDRFTLRLPDEVRKQLSVAQPKLKRTISLVALPRVSSSRRGYRSGGGGGGRVGGEGSGSSRYGRFFGRSFKWTTRNNGDGDGSTGSRRFFGTVVTPVEAFPRLPV